MTTDLELEAHFSTARQQVREYAGAPLVTQAANPAPEIRVIDTAKRIDQIFPYAVYYVVDGDTLTTFETFEAARAFTRQREDALNQ